MKKLAIILTCGFCILMQAGAADTSARLLLEAEIAGRLTFRDKSGLLITEVTKTAEKPLELGLEPGYYEITLQKGDSFYRSEVTLPGGGKVTTLSMAHFKLLNGDNSQPKQPAKAEAAAPRPAPKKEDASSWSFHPTMWVDGLEFVNFGFKLGSKYVYVTGNFGYSFGGYDEASMWADPITYISNDRMIYRGGLGFEIPLGPFFMDIEGLAGFITDLDTLSYSDFQQSSSFIGQARLIYGVKFAKHFGIYFGFSYDYIHALQSTSPMPADVSGAFFDYSDTSDIHRMGGFMGIQF